MKFEIHGNGDKTVILLHGGPSLYGYMMDIGEVLVDDLKVVDYAQRGTVECPSTPDLLTIDQHIKDLDQIVDQVSEGRKVFLLGHSWGASLGLLYAAKFSDKIEKLVLLGTASLTEEIGDMFGERFNSRLTQNEKTQLDNLNRRLESAKTNLRINELMNERLTLTNPACHFDRATNERMVPCKWDFHSFKYSIDALWDIIEAGEMPQILKKVTCQVVAIHGDTDAFPAEETFIFLRENLSKFDSILMKDSGHFPWIEETSEHKFFEELKKILD